MKYFLYFFFIALHLPLQATTIQVGSKAFTESYILGEIFTQALNHAGIQAKHRQGLGGTLICYEALKSAEIQLYPEYTGTITHAILKTHKELSFQAINHRLENVKLLPSLGFNNTYALAMARSKASALNVSSMSDLKNHPELTVSLTHEFIQREDGWAGLLKKYGFAHQPTGIEHALAYNALHQEKIHVTDVYTTDGEIARYDLLLLQDDLGFFPRYDCHPFIHTSLSSKAQRVIANLADSLDEKKIQELNAKVVMDQEAIEKVAADFLADFFQIETSQGDDSFANRAQILLKRTLRHLTLTGYALFISILVGVPLGIFAYQYPSLAKTIVYICSLLQTIPSIALLALLIPFLGIGFAPALVALILYALLPILRNTLTALRGIHPAHLKAAHILGMRFWQRLRWVEIPLAYPHILSGIKTAAVINIGTATLAAFVGAGGLGEPIVTGLTLNNPAMILEGAIPAILLAICLEIIFEGIEKKILPQHLRAKT